MVNTHPGLPLSDTLAAEHRARVRRLAADAWAEMERNRLLPTPRNFELLFNHLSGADPALSRRFTALLDGGALLTDAALETLHDECAGEDLDLDAFTDGTEAIQQAAQAMVDQVASGGEEIRRYGDTLSHWTEQLGQHRTLDGLVQAVTTLTGETARAAERNRTLEQQLSVAAARIVRLKDSLAEVRREATIDPLTSLCNRKAFDVRLRRALASARADQGAVSVLLLDLDHFKRVNDTYGHHAGDLVLRLVGRLLSDSVKGRDTAARHGGEEFAVILAGADLRAATIVAGQLRAGLDGKRLVLKGSGQHMDGVTVSIGVAQYRLGETPSSLMGRADAALYRAKHRGRNQVCAADATSAMVAA